jgi:hypothetical protein
MYLTVVICLCEISTLTINEQHRLQLFENKLIRVVFLSHRKE